MAKKKVEIIEEKKDPAIELAEKILDELTKTREALEKLVKRFV